MVIQQNDIKPIITDYHKLEGEMGVLVHNEGEQERLKVTQKTSTPYKRGYNPNTQSVSQTVGL